MLHLHSWLTVFALAVVLRPAVAGDGTPSAPEAPASRSTATGGPKDTEIATAILRGAAILLEHQEDYVSVGKATRSAKDEKDDAPRGKAEAKTPPREWPYEGVHRAAGDIPIGYRIGGTSICAQALVETAPGQLPVESRAAVLRALEFVLDGLRDPMMSAQFEKGYDTRGWGHAYGLSFLLTLRARALVPEQRKQDVDRAIRDLVKLLARTAIEKGGWNYSRPNGSVDSPPSTFMTAPTLQILFEAAKQGEQVDAAVVEKALATLEDARLETGAFQYGTNVKRRSGEGFEAVEGSIGRMPVCETTLYLAGRGSIERIRGAVDAFFAHWEWLEKRRKQTGTHVPPYMIAPYYFFYAHRYVAQAIEFLPATERPAYREQLCALLWKVREEDGGWNDRVFPRSESFGTAMSMQALHEPAADRPAAWKSAKASAKTAR